MKLVSKDSRREMMSSGKQSKSQQVKDRHQMRKNQEFKEGTDDLTN